MTNGEAQPPSSRGTRRDEAADWFAVMRGPEAETRGGEFQQWLGASALHREAYNRIAETFSLGKALKAGADAEAPIGDAPEGTSAAQAGHGKRRSAAAVLAAGAVLTGLWGGWTLLAPGTPTDHARTAVAETGSARPGSLAALELKTRVGEIRQFHLADGSVATLDTDSLIAVSFGQQTRALKLLRGRARFEVAHETRPFLVSAGRGTVRAVGTVFDVALRGGGRVDVRLLRGAVDVAVAADVNREVQIRRLTPGRMLSYGAASGPEVASLAGEADANWPSGLRDFDGAALASVLEDANRYASVPVRAGSPDVAAIRISGTFRVGDSAVLAANIAEVLGLARVTGPHGIVLTRTCPAPTPQENCSPAS